MKRLPVKGSPLGRVLDLSSPARRFLVLSFAAILAFPFAPVAGQDSRLSIKISDKPISEVLAYIEENSDYRFFFQLEQVYVERRVSLDIKNQDIGTILDKLFEGQNISHKLLEDNLILLYRDSHQSTGKETGTDPGDKIVVRGRVTDEQGNPIPGANLIETGTSNGSISDENGNYVIAVKDRWSVLQVSFVGYVTQYITVGTQTRINIVLLEKVNELEEVVIVGYGTQKVKDITGAVSEVSADEIEDRPILLVEDALAGKAAGVQVISPSGKPQSGAFIRIRGTTSIDGSSDPLYVIDGVPSEGMHMINPNDIENITILKDASASAIYGASGANGVVIITTKRGKNKKAAVEFNSYYGFSKVARYIDVLNSEQYIDLMEELGLSTDWSLYTANTNWQNEVFRTAPFFNSQLSLSGSDEKTNYYISGNWIKNDGVVRNNTADRYSAKINIDRQMNGWLKTGASIHYSRWHDVNITDNIGAARGGVILGMISTPEIIGIYNEDGTFTGNPLQSSWENPVASTDAPDLDYYQNKFLGSLYIEADILDGLKFRSMASMDYSNGQYNYFLDPYRTDWGRANSGIAQESEDAYQTWLSENTLRYSRTFGDHKLEAMAGFILSKHQYRSLYVQTHSFAGNAVKTVNGGSIIDGVSSSFAERSNVSQISRLNYDYRNKYLLTVNFRADASSVFGPGKRWGYFPSFSLGWRLSEEGFLDNLDNLDDFKLRVGWGQVGNDRIEEYAWYGRVGPGYNYVIGGVIVPGISIETLENKDLKWETTSQTDIGLDIMLFSYRLGITADIYVKNTSDLLLSMPIPRSSGFENTIQNVGEIVNRGIELQISSKNLVNTLRWNTDFNISLNRNRVIYLNEQVIYSGDIYQRGNVTIAREGEPLGSFFGYVAQGVDPATGMMIYKDQNEDGEITPDDREIIGNANPDFIYGLNNSLSYKGFELHLFIQGVYGNDVFNATRVESESMNDFKSQQATVLNRWKNPGDVTDMPVATLGEKYNSDLSTRFLEDGSYLRLKTLSLGYVIPRNLTSRLKIDQARIYVTAENLLTLTRYSGYDPEVNAFGGSNLAQGIDFGTYPQSRNFIIGVNLSF